MGYIGRGPSKFGAFRIIDDISSSFNGSTTAFSIQNGGANMTPDTEQNLIVAVDGVIQEPKDAFTISGSTITFTSAPATGAAFWGVELGDVGDNIPDAAVTSDKLATDAVTNVKVANNAITGDKIALGSDAQGDVMYYDGTDWVRLGAGTSGNFLKTQGTGANPLWAAAGGAALTGSTDNTLVTVTGTNAIAGEAGLTFDASAPTLKIRGESGAPATSSTTELAVLRLNPTGVTGTLDMGFHADSTGRAWIQATDTGN